MSLRAQLSAGLMELGLQVDPAAQLKLVDYIELIVKWNRVHNLTAVRDPEQMVSSHLLDSLAVAPHLSGMEVLDVGSGAGLPGIPLALLWPHARVTLLDSNHKKAAFLQQVIIELGIGNATVARERVETWQPARKFDIVISRAFADLGEFVKLSGHLCERLGVMAAMKGIYPYEELAQLPDDYKLQRVVELKVPGLQAARHLVLLAPQS